MEYRQHKDFMPSVRDLFQKGGSFQKAALQVRAIVGGIGVPHTDPFDGFRPTKHGENRVGKCRKFDLTGFARLITITEGNVTLFCFCGDHNACDAWLERNRGLTLVADEHGRMLDVQRTSRGLGIESAPTGPSALTRGKLYEGLTPETYFDRLVEGLPRQLVRKLEELESIKEESEIYEITKAIVDVERALAIYDVFALLRQDKRRQALDRAKLFLGETREVVELSEDEIRQLADSETIKTIRSDDPRFQRVFEHFVKSASYMDWMLFLHPDQQEVVDKDFSSPAKLSGVSGSGKTCIVVRRAVRLADKYESKRILILTLNRQLARLINDMVDAACPVDIRSRIDVKPFFSLCQELLQGFEPENDKLYNDLTWKSMEHIDEIWREYYRCELNNYSAKVLHPVHDSVIARSIDAEKYIREEFDWIRSAVPRADRKRYLDLERHGRSYPLDAKFRNMILDGLRFWEKKMCDIGVTDYLGIATALYHYIDRLEPLYRCILVDESQDFGTMEYQLVRKLVSTAENDLFFCGDAAQQVSAKHRSFRSAGIEIPSLFNMQVKRNYRNSREILRAAYDVLYRNLSEEMIDSGDFEILDPEYANFSAAPPLMLGASSLEEEIAFALTYLRTSQEEEPTSKGCISFCGYSLYEIENFGSKLNIPVLDGYVTIADNALYLSDLEHTKGFEFDTMIIVNCNEKVIPDPLKPQREQFRDLARFYVAMTRAKNQLVVSHSGSCSPLMASADTNFLVEDWSQYLLRDPAIECCVPSRLENTRHQGEGDAKDFLDMSGPEFLYTEAAIGLSTLLIEKLRNVVPGAKKTVNRTPVEWATIGNALADCEHNPRARQAFGPEGFLQFRALMDRVSPAGPSEECRELGTDQNGTKPRLKQ